MASQTTDPDILGIVSLAQRRVRTSEGAKLYGKPIGSPIGEAGDPDNGESERPITIERLRSLQAQFEAAKKVGDAGRMQAIQEDFNVAVAEFRKTRQDANVLREMTGERGQQAQAQQAG
jgi:hypothetical protein